MNLRRRAALAAAAFVAAACHPEVPSAPPEGDLPAAAAQPVATAMDSEPPELLAYPTPEVIGAKARLLGRKMLARLSWKAIAGDHRYQVQMSRTILFNRPTVEAEVRKPQYLARRLRPGAYFWRVRVVGELGEGAFSPAQRIEAPAPPTAGSERREPRPFWDDAFSPDDLVVAAPPLELEWTTPAHRSVVKASRIELIGRTTAGASLSVNGGRRVLVDGPFRIPASVSHGRNEMVLEVELGGQHRSLTRDIYYADPRRLAPVRERFEAVKKELEEIRELRRELVQMMLDLRRKASAMPVGGATQVEAELKKIQTARADLDTEVTRVIAELDHLLAE